MQISENAYNPSYIYFDYFQQSDLSDLLYCDEEKIVKKIKSESELLIWLFLFFGCLLMPAQTFSQTDAAVKTLKGFDSLKVEVEPLAPDLIKAGITTEQIQTDVETKLRQSGLKIKNANDTTFPYVVLFVSVNSIDNGVGGFAVSINTSLNQQIVLDREKSITSIAGTWESRSIVSVIKEKVQAIRDFVSIQIGAFINAHRRANETAIKPNGNK